MLIVRRITYGFFKLCVIYPCRIGGFLGFYFTKKKFEKELRENPPINEKMIRAMFLQMGRKPSEAQIKQIMKSVNANR